MMRSNFKQRSRRHREFQIAVTRIAGNGTNHCHGWRMRSRSLQFHCSYGPTILRGVGAARPYWIKIFIKKIREKKSVRKTAIKPSRELIRH